MWENVGKTSEDETLLASPSILGKMIQNLS